MKVTIEQAQNGYILKTPDGRFVFGEGNDSTMRKALADLLSEVVDQFGERGSRYDSDRIYISVGPGDKCLTE